MEKDLIAAIHDDPTNPGLRLTLADRWGDQPEAELVRILVDGPTYESSLSIQRWFDQNVGWPVLPGTTFRDLRFANHEIATEWLDRAFDPRRWPDRDLYHGAVFALARSMIPNARAFFPADNKERLKLEEVAASSPADLFSGVLANAENASGEELSDFCNFLDRRACMAVLRAARWIGMQLAATPWDLPREDCTGAVIEQFHILGWSWLGLPPLRPEAALDPPIFPIPGMPDAVRPETDHAGGPAGPLRSLWSRLFGLRKYPRSVGTPVA